MKQKLPDADVCRLQKIVAAETGITVKPETARRLYSALRMLEPAEPASNEGATVQEVTILLTDLRGFSAISEAYPPQVIFEVLNLYLARMCEIAIAHGGTINKFMGDAIMLLFGAPRQSDDDVRRALTCAVHMQIAMNEINRDLAARGLPALYMGAGINTGVVTAGMMGSELHREYTVIGDEVNIASRIETFCLRGQVLISEATYALCGGFVTTGNPVEVHVKGKSKSVLLREVLGIPSLGLAIPRRDARNSPRVETMLSFTYNLIVDKAVLMVVGSGIALDISYQGMLAEVEPGLTPYADILIVIEIPSISAQKQHIYAKVRNLRLDRGRHFAGIEFTSLNPQCERAIQRFVQSLIQGSATK